MALLDVNRRHNCRGCVSATLYGGPTPGGGDEGDDDGDNKRRTRDVPNDYSPSLSLVAPVSQGTSGSGCPFGNVAWVSPPSDRKHNLLGSAGMVQDGRRVSLQDENHKPVHAAMSGIGVGATWNLHPAYELGQHSPSGACTGAGHPSRAVVHEEDGRILYRSTHADFHGRNGFTTSTNLDASKTRGRMSNPTPHRLSYHHRPRLLHNR
ncbi:hypothetical protein LZ30DRAFT_694306 [Colletotrichum cereale]|nr:hypothetical protein LZ30DRAFT_694306 [Colletotrichum cereale]